MKTKVFQALIGVSAVYFLVLTAGLLPADSFAADNSQNLNEAQRVPLQISGTWQGAYHYDDPKRVDEVGNFTMNVSQQGSVISGTISEPNTLGVPGASTLSSTFSGTFDAGTMQINFTKTYDYDHHKVEYQGTVNSSGNEVIAAGRWQIGDYTGSWGMNR